VLGKPLGAHRTTSGNTYSKVFHYPHQKFYAPQQPYGRSGSTVLPASVIKAFVHFSRYKRVQSRWLQIRLLLKPNRCISAIPRHTVGCAISRTPPRAEFVLTPHKTKGMARHNRISLQHSCVVALSNAIPQYSSASYLPVCSLTSIAMSSILNRRTSCRARLFN
jgi:hypothetical protein